MGQLQNSAIHRQAIYPSLDEEDSSKVGLYSCALIYYIEIIYMNFFLLIGKKQHKPQLALISIKTVCPIGNQQKITVPMDWLAIDKWHVGVQSSLLFFYFFILAGAKQFKLSARVKYRYFKRTNHFKEAKKNTTESDVFSRSSTLGTQDLIRHYQKKKKKHVFCFFSQTLDQ